MGSPLSPIVASIFMEDLETQALEMSPHKPRMWLRCVDDVFAIWPHGDCLLESFHQHRNGQNPSIQFTMEREKICRPLGVKTVMKTADTLRSRLVKVKQTMPSSKKV